MIFKIVYSFVSGHSNNCILIKPFSFYWWSYIHVSWASEYQKCALLGHRETAIGLTSSASVPVQCKCMLCHWKLYCWFLFYWRELKWWKITLHIF
jgi:hypothetical protein